MIEVSRTDANGHTAQTVAAFNVEAAPVLSIAVDEFGEEEIYSASEESFIVQPDVYPGTLGLVLSPHTAKAGHYFHHSHC